MFRIVKLTFFGLLTVALECLQAQSYCGTPAPSFQETSLFQQTVDKASQNFRRETLNIPVHVVIVYGDSTESSFDESYVVKLINHANDIFSNITVRFFIANESIVTVHSDRFQNFQTSEESELRSAYDRQDAINIYFVKTITRPEGTQLNGYTSLPSLSNQSNRVFFSYLSNSPGNFEILKDKTFLHELGHYFGLLHTFNDSENEDPDKRELVTRGIGANCSYTGDYLCDTPADPYDLSTQSAAIQCTENSIQNALKDFRGEVFRPAYDNIMSYHVGCGNSFTPQQYQRMEALISIRVSPQAEYNLTGTPASYLATDPPAGKWFCNTEKLSFGMRKQDFEDPNNRFITEISDENGENFHEIPALVAGDSVLITLDETYKSSPKYRLRVSSTSPAYVGYPSSHFEIREKGEIRLAAIDSVVNANTEAKLKVDLSGSGLWNFRLSDGTEYKDILENTLILTKSVSQSTDFYIMTAWQSCDLSISPERARIKVAAPEISFSNQSDTVICSGQLVQLYLSNLKAESLASYQVEITGNGDTVYVQPQYSTVGVYFLMPEQYSTNQTYAARLISPEPGDYSEYMHFRVNETPEIPDLDAAYTFCQNEEANGFNVNALQFRWYRNDINLTAFEPSFQVETSVPGHFSVYASKVNEAGCESDKRKVNFNIKALPVALISGNAEVIRGDSAYVNLKLEGGAPWKITLSNEITVFAEDSVFDLGILPENTQTIHIISVENECGTGNASGEARIILLEPLSNHEELEIMKLYPNPSHSAIRITGFDSDTHGLITIYDELGRPVFSEEGLFTKGEVQISVEHLRAGRYVLIWENSSGELSRSFIKK